MGGPGLEGSLQLWLLPSCKGPGSQSLPDTLTPFTAPFTSSRLASLVPTYSLVPSQLFQGASLMRQLFSFLISSRETWASCPTNVPLPPGLPAPPTNTHTLTLPGAASSLCLLPVRFPSPFLSACQQQLHHFQLPLIQHWVPGTGAWNAPLPTILFQALLWP